MQRTPSHSAERLPQDRFAASGQAIGCAVGFSPTMTSVVSGWNNLALFAWRGHCGEAKFEPFEEPVIVYHIGGARSVAVRANQRWTQSTHPGLITIIPPETRVDWNICGEVHSRTLNLSSRFLDSASDCDKPSTTELRFRSGIHDALIAAVIDTLEREIRMPSQVGSLYADSIADTLALHLLNTHAVKTQMLRTPGGLPARVLQRSLERLEASIVSGISLQELADEAGLSRTYFADAFRKATGMAPHRYLTQRRLEQARELLRNSSLPITEIALQCGFSSQSHLSASFRSAYDTSPRQYRSEMGIF